jgi:putative hydrolase of the HAD superfamily
MQPLLIFDGDDTLWITEPLYDIARLRAADIVSAAGFDSSEWDSLERTIDVANVDRFGMNRLRFPTSCVQALDSLAANTDRPVPPELRAEVWEAGSGVFNSVAPLAEGAEVTLARLAGDFRLALLTKGDDEVQQKRIVDSGLAHRFQLITVVAAKDAAAFRAVRESLGARGVPTWSIGNSLNSDVLPALEADIQAIWIEAHVWEYERHSGDVPRGVFVADRLTAVPAILGQAMAATGLI